MLLDPSPLSQTVTPSRTPSPSSVTYFMDGPQETGWAYTHGRRPGAEFGGTQNNFRGPISGKISISRVKISDDLFFSHRPGCSDFSFLFPHFPYVYYVKCRIYDHFLTRKTQFSLCSCFHAHPTTLLLKILGGTNAWAVPPPQLLGGTVPPSPP